MSQLRSGLRRGRRGGRDGGAIGEAVGTRAARARRRSGRRFSARGGRETGGRGEAALSGVRGRGGAVSGRTAHGGWQVGPTVGDFRIKIHPKEISSN
jgi:hypothetical protein